MSKTNDKYALASRAVRDLHKVNRKRQDKVDAAVEWCERRRKTIIDSLDDEVATILVRDGVITSDEFGKDMSDEAES